MNINKGAPSADDFESWQPFWASIGGRWVRGIKTASGMLLVAQEALPLRWRSAKQNEINSWAHCEPPVILPE